MLRFMSSYHVIVLCYHILSPSLHHPFLPSHHTFLLPHHPFLPSHHPFLPSHHPFLPSHHPFITSSLFICSLISHTKLIYLTHRTPGCSRCSFRQMFNLSCRGWNVQTCWCSILIRTYTTFTLTLPFLLYLLISVSLSPLTIYLRSEERRVGKECRP